MFIKYYDNIHPDSELVIESLNKKIVSSRNFTLKFALIEDFDLLFLGGALLQIRDSVSQLFQKDIQIILDGFVSRYMDSVSEIISEIRSLEHNIVIAFGLDFEP
jgi:hypothetical protein